MRRTLFAERAEAADHDRARLGDWLEALERRLLEMATAHGVGEEDAWRLGLALREALLNALRHGRDAEGRCRVAVRCHRRRDGRLVLRVRDCGRGFDPRAVPAPLAPENLDRGSGRGLFCIRGLGHRIAFAFPRLGGTAVQIELRPRRA
jgi:serine/threonine-protein kinase RsbW